MHLWTSHCESDDSWLRVYAEEGKILEREYNVYQEHHTVAEPRYFQGLRAFHDCGKVKDDKRSRIAWCMQNAMRITSASKYWRRVQSTHRSLFFSCIRQRRRLKRSRRGRDGRINVVLLLLLLVPTASSMPRGRKVIISSQLTMWPQLKNWASWDFILG